MSGWDPVSLTGLQILRVAVVSFVPLCRTVQARSEIEIRECTTQDGGGFIPGAANLFNHACLIASNSLRDQFPAQLNMSGDERFDSLFMTVAQQANGIEPLLDQLFGFLRRKTDFYTVSVCLVRPPSTLSLSHTRTHLRASHSS